MKFFQKYCIQWILNFFFFLTYWRGQCRCTHQRKGCKSSKPHRDHPGQLKMRGIAKPHPINNSSIRSSTTAHWGRDCVSGFPGSFTDKNIPEQCMEEIHWVVSLRKPQAQMHSPYLLSACCWTLRRKKTGLKLNLQVQMESEIGSREFK